MWNKEIRKRSVESEDQDCGVCYSWNDHSLAAAFSQVGGSKWQRERVISAKGRVERVSRDRQRKTEVGLRGGRGGGTREERKGK